MDLKDFQVYQRAMELGDKVWSVVNGWTWFQRNTIGKQLVRAVDSIAANLSEGLGRYHYRERINFGYYSRGSLYETQTWLTKAKNRNLISNEEYDSFINEIKNIGIKLNNHINTNRKQTTQKPK
jgi:four helix bundle protein